MSNRLQPASSARRLWRCPIRGLPACQLATELSASIAVLPAQTQLTIRAELLMVGSPPTGVLEERRATPEVTGFGKSSRQFGSQISGLFEWPRAGDEDIYQSPGALLPVGAGRHVGDADKNPK